MDIRCTVVPIVWHTTALSVPYRFKKHSIPLFRDSPPPHPTPTSRIQKLPASGKNIVFYNQKPIIFNTDFTGYVVSFRKIH
jgi:hypothetical protein